MKTLALIGIILVSYLKGPCQIIVAVNTGYGSNNMGDMKSVQNQVAGNFLVKPRIGPSFPAYWFFDANVKRVSKSKVLFGVSFASGSTGGRVYYSDYSGDQGADQLLSYKSYQLALGFQKKFLGGHLIVEGDLRPGITATDLKMKSYLSVGTYSETDKEYKSQNFVVQPTVTIGGRFGPVGIQGFVGYNLTAAAGQLNLVGAPGYLQTNNGAVHADWSGLRMGGGVSFYMHDSQKTKDEPDGWQTAFGVGLGLDYGGIGVNVLTYPGKYVGMFAGVGYALAGVGYNAGVKFRTKPLSSPKACLYFLGMYGYNAAIAVQNNSDYSRLFYGPTAGVGIDFGPRPAGYWSLGLLLPIRSSEVNEYINALPSVGIKTTGSLIPVTITVGYRINPDH